MPLEHTYVYIDHVVLQQAYVKYPAKPGYSHCVKAGRSDLHFTTAGCGKKTMTIPTNKTERGVGHIQLARSGDHSRTMPLSMPVTVSEHCDVIRVYVKVVFASYLGWGCDKNLVIC